MVGMTGAFLHVIDVESPWLNGRTERSHQELKNQIDLMLMEVIPQSEEEWLAVVASATAARNASRNEKGFSPIQRVLGTAPRVAGELCMDGWPDSIYEGPLQAMRRSADIRHVANRAYLEQQHRARLRTALRIRHRRMVTPLTPGMRVWIWRKPQRGRLPGWYGPGPPVSGALWKVTEQNMRPQSEDDKLGWEMVKRFLHHLKNDMAQEKPLKKRYVDCTREPAPQEEDTPAYPMEARPEGFDQQMLEDEPQHGQSLDQALDQDVAAIPEETEVGLPPMADEDQLDPELLEAQRQNGRGDVRTRGSEESLEGEPPQQRPRIEDAGNPYR
eukprot:3451668-Amphidinium_carterae.1